MVLRREVADQFVTFVERQCGGPEGGTPVLVAHNGVKFDLPMLSAEFERVGMSLPPHWAYLDTFVLAQVAPPPHVWPPF